jgi:DNA-binding NtrC family response regulator
MAEQPRILIVDDGEMFARVLTERMPEWVFVHPNPEKSNSLPRAQDGVAAMHFLEERSDDVDIVLLDLHFDVPDDRLLPLDRAANLRELKRFQGLAVLRAIRTRFPSLPVVLLTAREDLELGDVLEDVAAESMTYFLDTEDLDVLRIRVNQALKEAALNLEESGILWGTDARMRALRRRMAVLARGRLPIILEGETGTGKSLLAQAFIHPNSGRNGPFVTLDLSTLPHDLIPATLFGSIKGSFTGSVQDQKGVFQLANRGTLFLDEIQNVPIEIQRQLLLVLQEGKVRPLGGTRDLPVDVKIVVASNTPLSEAVARGRFRADLYMRLSPATRVIIPPLRERVHDLMFFARRFVEDAAKQTEIRELIEELALNMGFDGDEGISLRVGRASRRKESYGGIVLELAKPTWDVLAKHPWPGNLRELYMVLSNLVTFTLVDAVEAVRSGLVLEKRRLQVDPGLVHELLAGVKALDQDAEPMEPESPDNVRVHLEPGLSLNEVAKSVERQYFLSLFRQTRGDFESMADLLLGDTTRSRAIRLRFNQLGLKVRELRN